jgi:hypothetical protein
MDNISPATVHDTILSYAGMIQPSKGRRLAPLVIVLVGCTLAG